MSHIAVFEGQINKLIYRARYWGKREYDIYKDYEFLGYEEICEINLDNPIMKNGEEIYLDSIDKIVKIKRVVRTTHNNVIYYTDHVIDTIKDEETIQSKNIADKRVEKWKKWYRFWK